MCLFFGRGFFPSHCSQAQSGDVQSLSTGCLSRAKLDYMALSSAQYGFLSFLPYLRPPQFLPERRDPLSFPCVFYVVCTLQVMSLFILWLCISSFVWVMNWFVTAVVCCSLSRRVMCVVSSFTRSTHCLGTWAMVPELWLCLLCVACSPYGIGLPCCEWNNTENLICREGTVLPELLQRQKLDCDRFLSPEDVLMSTVSPEWMWVMYL